MISLARFDLPAAPSGWEGAGTDLVRIVDPRGEAIAWLAPRFGGACVGFAIRQANPQSSGDGWLHALVSGTPDLARSQPEAVGCVPIGDAVLDASWDLVQRDPTGAVLASAHHGLALTAQIDDGILHLSLTAAQVAALTLDFAATIPLDRSNQLTIEGTGGAFAADIERPEETAVIKRYIGSGGAVSLAIGRASETPAVEPEVR